MRYTYDESGVTFYYFVLSMVAIVLVPYTVHFFFGKQAIPAKSCTCPSCLDRIQHIRQKAAKQSRSTLKLAMIAAGWALLAVLTHSVMTTEIDFKVWDPYEVMGISSSATAAQIKKQYKVLSLQFHPDKVEEDQKEESGKRFVDITKAYKVLTDDEIRKNYEEWGHPDGKQAFTLGIALPAWLVEDSNGNWVLLVYGLVFGFVIPFAVGKWWYRSRNYTKDQIEHRTMGMFFRELKDGVSQRFLLDIVCSAAEFRDLCAWKEGVDDKRINALMEQIKAICEAKANGDKYERPRRFTAPFIFKASVLLHTHLHRVELNDPELQELQVKVVSKCAHLILGMLQICLSRGWLETSLKCMDLSQCFIQGMTTHDQALLQLPYFDYINARQCKSKKRTIRTIRQLVEMDDEERRAMLGFVNDEEYTEIMRVASIMPIASVPQTVIKVIGDAAITPGSIVTLLVKIRVQETQALVESVRAGHDEDEEPMTAAEADTLMEMDDAKLRGNGTVGYAHAPRFFMNKKPFWWIIFCDIRGNQLVAEPVKITDVNGVAYVKFQLQAPPRIGTYAYNVILKSDTFLGVDVKKDVFMEVQDASILPPEQVYEDEISEPDEDSIAGQMAMMRAQQTGAAPAVKSTGSQAKQSQQHQARRDSDTSEDEE